jgi:hypothetical protein
MAAAGRAFLKIKFDKKSSNKTEAGTVLGENVFVPFTSCLFDSVEIREKHHYLSLSVKFSFYVL